MTGPARTNAGVSVLLVPALAAVVLAAASCAPHGPVGDPPAEGSAGAMALRAADGALPTVAAPALADAERRRVGGLTCLWARGIAEIRWVDASGDHFEQGDLDLRWSAGQGIAASVSKFGDRHAWIGSDGERWWRFAPKASPSTLDVGLVRPPAGADRSPVDECSVNPALLGMAPLLPAPESKVEVRDGLAWVDLDASVLPAGDGIRFDAGFDPVSLLPRRACMRLDSGEVLWSAEYHDFVSVEQAGTPPGAWPKLPRRVVARRGSGGASLLLVLDRCSIDAEATDRPAMYDLQALRERFSPEVVRGMP